MGDDFAHGRSSSFDRCPGAPRGEIIRQCSDALFKTGREGSGSVYALFFMMGFAVLAAVVAIPIVAAAFLPWWGTLLIILAELVFLRYTLLRIVGIMFAIFVGA